MLAALYLRLHERGLVAGESAVVSQLKSPSRLLRNPYNFDAMSGCSCLNKTFY